MASAQKYENAAQWLMDAGIAYFSYNTHNLLLPFEQYEKRNLYKVFLLDTGLLCSMRREPIQWQVLNGEIDINEGALTENFVATELVKKGYVLHYYDHKSRQELDFLVAQNNKINIIEVKSGNDYKRYASLDAVLEGPNPTLGDLMVISKFPIIKILPHTTGVLAAYETRTAHLPDDSTPKIALFGPQKFPIIKIRVRQMDRKSQTAMLIGKCDHCLRSPHKLKFAGTPFPLAKL